MDRSFLLDTVRHISSNVDFKYNKDTGKLELLSGILLSYCIVRISKIFFLGVNYLHTANLYLS